jgi:hypothetical protein
MGKRMRFKGDTMARTRNFREIKMKDYKGGKLHPRAKRSQNIILAAYHWPPGA